MTLADRQMPQRGRRPGKSAVRPAHLARKLALVAVLAAGLFGYFAVGEYRVVADGKVEGAVQRSIVAALTVTSARRRRAPAT
ncbi:MAG: hypothetical protein WDO24_04800 [Pseudomonadota bacterium]